MNVPVVTVRARSGWRTRRPRLGLSGADIGRGPFIAFPAIQFGPERFGTSLSGCHPGAIDPRRIVPDVLVVATLELGNPVPFLVSVKSGDLSVHRLSAGENLGSLRGARLGCGRFCDPDIDAVVYRTVTRDPAFERAHNLTRRHSLRGRARLRQARALNSASHRVRASRSIVPLSSKWRISSADPVISGHRRIVGRALALPRGGAFRPQAKSGANGSIMTADKHAVMMI